MRMLLLIVLLAVINTARADYYYIELGLGNNTNLTGSSIPWNDGGGTGTMFSVGWVVEADNGLFVKLHWTHYSQIEIGPPFNNLPESSLDHFGFALQKRWK